MELLLDDLSNELKKATEWSDQMTSMMEAGKNRRRAAAAEARRGRGKQEPKHI